MIRLYYEIMKEHKAEKRFTDLNAVTVRQLKPLPPKPVFSNIYVPTEGHHNHGDVTNTGLRTLESQTQETEILDKVMKVVELERKRRTYVYELCYNIAETERKRTEKMRTWSSDTLRLHLPSSTHDQERQPSPSSPLPSPTLCEEKLAKQMEKMNVN